MYLASTTRSIDSFSKISSIWNKIDKYTQYIYRIEQKKHANHWQERDHMSAIKLERCHRNIANSRRCEVACQLSTHREKTHNSGIPAAAGGEMGFIHTTCVTESSVLLSRKFAKCRS